MRHSVMAVSSEHHVSIRFAKVFLKGVDLCASSAPTLPTMMKIEDRNMLSSYCSTCLVLPLHTKETSVA